MTELYMLLPAGLVFVAVALGTVSFVLLWESGMAAKRRRSVMRRLETPGAPQADATGLIRAGANDEFTTLEHVLASVPWLRDAGIRLRQAGVSWSVTTYLALAVGAALSFGLAAVIISGSLLVGMITAAAGGALPDLYMARRRLGRARRFEEQFPEAVDLLGRAIRAGHPLSAGIRMVAEEAPEPVCSEFRQVFDEQRFGLPMEDALLGLSDRNELLDVRIFVTAVMIQREVGGNLAEILDKISQTVRARFKILRQLRVYTAQGRLSGYILAAMPIVMAVAIYFLDRDYIMLLVEEPMGRLMIGAGVVMQIIGFMWIRRIVNIEI